MRERPRGEDESLVGRLYDSYGVSLYRYAVMLLADPAAAEDAVHQVFAALLKRRADLHLENEAHYLRRAVRNECYSFRRRPRTVSSQSELALLELLPDARHAVSPEERLTLEQALRALPIEQRDVVHLHAFEGMTLQEVAAVCGESINTVASRYRYAVARLREAFGQ